MSDTPDGRAKRRYDSSRRQAQARATQGRILEAAHRLFTTRGYAGTTIEAVAREAGVATETVYSAFGSKRTLLAKLVDRAVLGEDEPAPMLERRGPQRVKAEPDQRRQLRLFAHGMAAIITRVGPLFGVMRAAAMTDPEIAELLQRTLDTRRENLRGFVDWVARNGPLRAGLSLDEAADVVWALSSAELRQLLVGDRAWEEQRYEQWLAATLIALLLPSEGAGETDQQ